MRLPLVFGAAFIVARGARAALGLPGMLALSEALWVMATTLVMETAVRHALRAGAVDRERILAALDAYLLAGPCSGSRTGSSTGRGPDRSGVRSPSAWRSRSNFSFVTLATLGYGDVVPVSEPARGLAIVE